MTERACWGMGVEGVARVGFTVAGDKGMSTGCVGDVGSESTAEAAEEEVVVAGMVEAGTLIGYVYLRVCVCVV